MSAGFRTGAAIMECAGCREEFNPLGMKYLWCPDCRAYICLTCVKETGGKCPSCGGPALGLSLRVGLIVLLVMATIVGGVYYITWTMAGQADIRYPDRMVFFWWGLLLLIVFLSASVVVMMVRRNQKHERFISSHQPARVPSVNLVEKMKPAGIYDDMGIPPVQVEWHKNNQLRRMRFYVASDTVICVIVLVLMAYFSRVLGHMDYLYMMLNLTAVILVPAVLLPFLINFLAWTPSRVGISPEGVFFDYARELRIYHPLKSVRWKNIDRTFYYEPLNVSTFTFIIGDALKQVHIDKTLHKPLQERFESIKGIDEKRDINQGDNLITH